MNGTSPRIRIKIKCHTCQERLTVVGKPYARNLKCPECEAKINVPAYDPVEAEFQKKLAEPLNVDPGVYSIAGISESAEPEQETAETVKMKCPHCLSLLHPELKTESWMDTCPDCLEEYRVPAKAEVPEPIKTLPIPDPGSYQAGLASKPTPLNTEVYEKMSEIRGVEVDPPPRSVYFSSVWGYPWSKYAWPKWVWTSVGWTLSWLLVSLSLYLILVVSGVGVLAGGIICLPSFWLVFWTLSYTSACGMTILEGTGAGQVVIDEWPEPDWREWAVNLLYLTFLGLVAQGVSVLVEPFVQFLPAPWLVSLALVHLIYPVILLSALESGSVFWPVSVPVYQSMLSHFRYWVLYYLLAGGLSLVFLVVTFISLEWEPLLCGFWMGTIATTVIFLHCRLLGRLGWRTIIEPDGGKKRLRKLEKIRRYHEEPFGHFEPVPPTEQSKS